MYPAGGRCGPRIQSDYQLVILLAGALNVRVEQKEFELKPGDGILQFPGNEECYCFDASGQSEHTWAAAAPEAFTLEETRTLLRVSGVHPVPAAVHVLINEGLGTPAIENEALNRAFVSLARTCILHFAASALQRAPINQPPPPALERALELVIRQHSSIDSVADLARKAGISSGRLRLLFRQFCGESPRAMIWRLRAQRALQLVRSTGLSLGEIAQQSGFANAFHLSRAIKRTTGYSPRALREREWTKPNQGRGN